jgi:hypothetical protein
MHHFSSVLTGQGCIATTTRFDICQAGDAHIELDCLAAGFGPTIKTHHVNIHREAPCRALEKANNNELSIDYWLENQDNFIYKYYQK